MGTRCGGKWTSKRQNSRTSTTPAQPPKTCWKATWTAVPINCRPKSTKYWAKSTWTKCSVGAEQHAAHSGQNCRDEQFDFFACRRNESQDQRTGTQGNAGTERNGSSASSSAHRCCRS